MTLDIDTLAHLLAVERRRLTIDCLDQTESWRLRDLTDQLLVLLAEADSDDYQDRKAEYKMLKEDHLPKLDSHDVIEFDRHRIEQGPAFEVARDGLESLRETVNDEQRVLPDGGRDPTQPGGDFTVSRGVAAEDAIPAGSRRSPVQCPNRGESYRRHQGADVTERHPVSTDTTVVRRGGQLGLKIAASCPCGWSDKVVITDE